MFGYQLESSRSRGPLLSNPFFEPELTSLVREIFHIAQSSDNNQLQQFAAWGISFLGHCSWFRPPQKENTFEEDAVGSVSQRLPKDSLVIKVSLWLMHLDPEVCHFMPCLISYFPYISELRFFLEIHVQDEIFVNIQPVKFYYLTDF